MRVCAYMRLYAESTTPRQLGRSIYLRVHCALHTFSVSPRSPALHSFGATLSLMLTCALVRSRARYGYCRPYHVAGRGHVEDEATRRHGITRSRRTRHRAEPRSHAGRCQAQPQEHGQAAHLGRQPDGQTTQYVLVSRLAFHHVPCR